MAEKHPTARLLVEGIDDFHVVHAICNKFNINAGSKEKPNGGKFSIENSGNYDKLLEQISVQLKSSPDFKTLGIVVDADENSQNRWQSIKDKLKSVGFSNLKELPKEGLIVENNDQKVGVWIMPNNDLGGMLEDFIAFLVPENDALLVEVDTHLCNIERKNINKYTPIHRSKARIHSWLACQQEPGTPLGQSITASYFKNIDHVTGQLFITWLKNLFE